MARRWGLFFLPVLLLTSARPAASQDARRQSPVTIEFQMRLFAGSGPTRHQLHWVATAPRSAFGLAVFCTLRARGKTILLFERKGGFPLGAAMGREEWESGPIYEALSGLGVDQWGRAENQHLIRCSASEGHSFLKNEWSAALLGYEVAVEPGSGRTMLRLTLDSRAGRPIPQPFRCAVYANGSLHEVIDVHPPKGATVPFTVEAPVAKSSEPLSGVNCIRLHNPGQD